MPSNLVWTGLDGFIAGIESMSGKELAQTANAVVKKSATRTAVPALRTAARAAMKRPGSHRDPKPRPGAAPMRVKRGASGPIDRSITVRNAKKRRGELVAVTIAPRAWYRHFFIGATRPHVIEARDAQGNRASRGEVRTINRLDRGYYSGNASEVHALAVGDKFFARVHHPGTAAHPFIDPQMPAIGQALQRDLSEEMVRKAVVAIRKGNARSAARSAAKAASAKP